MSKAYMHIILLLAKRSSGTQSNALERSKKQLPPHNFYLNYFSTPLLDATLHAVCHRIFDKLLQNMTILNQ